MANANKVYEEWIVDVEHIGDKIEATKKSLIKTVHMPAAHAENHNSRVAGTGQHKMYYLIGDVPEEATEEASATE